MDTVRDLGRVEPWQESLERSQARRRRSQRASAGRDERRLERRPAHPTPARRQAPARHRRATRSRIRRRRAVALLVLAIPGLVVALAGQGPQRAPTAAQASAISGLAHARWVDSAGAGPLSRWPVLRVTAAGLTRACRPSSDPSGYVDPLGDARVRPERIDQGVDYAGSGTLATIGTATLTYVGTTDTGWPGSFIEYRLLDGADAGCYVYYAEGVNPAAGLRVGETVAAGQPIASIIPGWPTGIELGWGAGITTATYAAEAHQWSATNDQDSIASPAGKTFSALVASLGGPPGKVEG